MARHGRTPERLLPNQTKNAHGRPLVVRRLPAYAFRVCVSEAVWLSQIGSVMDESLGQCV